MIISFLQKPAPVVIPVSSPDALTRCFVVANVRDAGDAVAHGLYECRHGHFVADAGWAEPLGEGCWRATVRLRHRNEMAMLSSDPDGLHARRLREWGPWLGGDVN